MTNEKNAATVTGSEQVAMAREIAADKYAGCYNQTGERRAFSDGWDAALAWVKEQGAKTELERPSESD